MKICENCGREVEEEISFCPKCGSELKDKNKLSYAEKREAKEREKQFLLSKASIRKEDLENAEKYNDEKIFFTEKGSSKVAINWAFCKLIIETVAFILGIIWVKYISNKNLDSNVKLLIIFLIFIVCAIMIALFISDLHYYLSLKKMVKSKIAIKKIKYGENPLIYFDNRIFEISLLSECEKCNSKMHIEEVDGIFVAVCNKDREHILVMDSVNICQKCEEKFRSDT